MRTTLAREWQSYRTEVVPADAGQVQLSETKQAFYSGAWAVLNALMAVSSDDVSEDDGAIYIETLRQECIAFAETVAKRPLRV